MSAARFIEGQVAQIRLGGLAVLVKKLKLLLIKFFKLPLYIFAIFALLIIRLIKPWLLVRIGLFISSRIGHFAATTELYLCERDALINVPRHRHLDILFM